MQIVINEKRTIEVTPEVLAEIFWNMDNDEQAQFFHCLSVKADGKLDEQMEIVALNTDSLSQKALLAMAQIGYNAIERMKE